LSEVLSSENSEERTLVINGSSFGGFVNESNEEEENFTFPFEANSTSSEENLGIDPSIAGWEKEEPSSSENGAGKKEASSKSTKTFARSSFSAWEFIFNGKRGMLGRSEPFLNFFFQRFLDYFFPYKKVLDVLWNSL